MRILVTNAVLGNSGDAAICEGILDAITRHSGHEVSVDIHDADARTSSELFPAWNIYQQPTFVAPHHTRLRRIVGRIATFFMSYALIRSAKLRKLSLKPGLRKFSFFSGIARLASADAVISSGGTYLVDHYRFGDRVLEIRLAAAFDRPVILWTQSMGPFRSRRAKRWAGSIAEASSAIYFRDQLSMTYLQSVADLPQVATVIPDAAFSMDAVGGHSEGSDTRTAIISVRHWGKSIDGGVLDFENYTESLRALASRLLAEGWTCIALSTCQGVPGYRTDDSEVAAQIFRGLRVIIDSDYHAPSDLLDVLASADLVISTRMHLAILSLVAGTPVVAIAYEFKTMELFGSLGLSDYAMDMSKVSAAWLTEIAEQAFTDREPVLSAAQRQTLRVGADSPARLLASTVN